MSTTRSRIPRKVSDFDAYINTTKQYLQLSSPPTGSANPNTGATGPSTRNWERLTFLSAENDMWMRFCDEHNALHEKYVDKHESRTTAIKDKLLDNQKRFIAFAQPLLVRISGSPYVNIDDLEVFHIKSGPLRDSNPTRREKIEDQLAVSAECMGGSFIKFRCRRNEDETRASMHKLADVIELRYSISETPPTNPILLNGLYSTKAIFTEAFGEENIGKKVFYWARWRNNISPNLSGPWSELGQIAIS